MLAPAQHARSSNIAQGKLTLQIDREQAFANAVRHGPRELELLTHSRFGLLRGRYVDGHTLQTCVRAAHGMYTRVKPQHAPICGQAAMVQALVFSLDQRAAEGLGETPTILRVDAA